MTYNSVLKALFLDGRPEFTMSGESTSKHISNIGTLFVAYTALTVDFSVLFMMAILFIRHSFMSPILQVDGLVTSLCLSVFVLVLFHLRKLQRIETVGKLQVYHDRISTASSISAVTLILLYPVFSIYFAPADDQSAADYWLWAGIWLGTTALALFSLRYAFIQSFCVSVSHELAAPKIVIVGATALAEQFIERAKTDVLGARVNAIFDDNASAATPAIADVPVKGTIADLFSYHKENEIDTIVIASPIKNNDGMRQLIQQLSGHAVKVTMLPDLLDLKYPSREHELSDHVSTIHGITITDAPLENTGRLIKSLFDKIIAATAIVLFAPLMICCAVGIKLTSPGPILFKQKRIGYQNCEFDVFKFRSMHISDCNTGKLTMRNDPRVFAFGQLMRKLSFDELPQLFNVLNGDMSLVGPRPHMPEARAGGHLYFDAVSEYLARHRVKPGITGWAQVNGWRGPTETINQLEMRVMHDLYYIENWSFWLDLKILVKTVFVGFGGKNAF